jgi:hypothetical protein
MNVFFDLYYKSTSYLTCFKHLIFHLLNVVAANKGIQGCPKKIKIIKDLIMISQYSIYLVWCWKLMRGGDFFIKI